MTEKFNITEETRCFVCRSRVTLIDFIHPHTGKTLYFSKSADDLLTDPDYPDVDEMSFGEFMTWKATRQRTPIAWNEEVTEERFDYMLGCLPPAAVDRDAFLVGEPYDHDALSGEPRYQGFRQTGAGYFASSRPMTVKEFRSEVGDTL